MPVTGPSQDLALAPTPSAIPIKCAQCHGPVTEPSVECDLLGGVLCLGCIQVLAMEGNEEEQDVRDQPIASVPVAITSGLEDPRLMPYDFAGHTSSVGFTAPVHLTPGLLQSIPSSFGATTNYTHIITPQRTQVLSSATAGTPKSPVKPRVSVKSHSYASSARRYSPPPNPLLDIGRLRTPTQTLGTLYPSSTFQGTQTSGRASYDVQVQILTVNLSQATLSGYLSISHLTDAHPKLTTFFSGEIIGPTYGFLTGEKYYALATEQDDIRHWSRFPHFGSVRNILQQPGLTLPPDPAGDRPFVFMRWKERFLVPDHKVKDISGASFAGFYYLQLDLGESSATSPLVRKERVREVSYLPVRPGLDARASGRTVLPDSSPPTGSTPMPDIDGVPIPDARPVLQGYYFHHQNSEPFQELSLRHVPQRGSGSFDIT